MTIEPFLDKVYNCDVMDLLKQLPDKSVDMIYGDPDYNVDYKYGINRDKSYTKPFNEYIDWYIRLSQQCKRIVKDDGNMFFINYPKANSYLRIYLDRVCYDVQDYVWIYNTMQGQNDRRFTTAHRSILHARVTENNKWFNDKVSQSYKNLNDKRIKERIESGKIGTNQYSWFYYDLIKNTSQEKTIHSCQIPQELFTMLLKVSTIKQDIVIVLFGGSGGELEICKLLERHYISAEIDETYYKMIIDRLETGLIKEKYSPDGRVKCGADKLELTTKTLSLLDWKI